MNRKSKLIEIQHHLVADREGLARQHVTGGHFVVFQGVVAVHFHFTLDDLAFAGRAHAGLARVGQLRTLLVTRIEDALAVARQVKSQGAELPYSCKAGVCSTCKCKVIEGEVEMDSNHALEDYEVAAGYVLSCQAFPISDKVVLDFDQL